MRTHVLLLLGASACSGGYDAHFSNVGARDGQAQRGALAVLDSEGEAVELRSSDTTVTVETRRARGQWADASDVEVDWSGADTVDVVVVADNSGSEVEHVEAMRDAIDQFTHVLLAREHADRVGLVRVSTEPAIVQGLTTDATEMQAATAAMFVNSGWTALWDGIRLANEVIADSAVAHEGETTCASGAYAAVVAFTDGRDNNSAGEQTPGDGVDTTADDAADLRVFGARTPVYTVGIGREVATAELEDVAERSGGQHRSIQGYLGLTGALRGTAAKLSNQVPVCFVAADCADTEARITVQRGSGAKAFTGTAIVEIATTCDPA